MSPRVKKEQAGETRARFIETSIDLLQEKGYHAVGLNEIIETSGSPRGSLYYHFPGGKDELVTAALEEAGRRIHEELGHRLGSAASPTSAVEAVIEFFESILIGSDFRKGCPIATVAGETQVAKPAISETCARIYSGWEKSIADFLDAVRPGDKTNRETARILLALVEGALLLAKVHRDRAYLASARDSILAML